MPLFLYMKLSELKDNEKVLLIENRWNSSDTVWDLLNKMYEANTKAYDNEPDWLKQLPQKKSKVRSNRIFRDTESVINTLIANPPKPNFIPTRETDQSRELAQTLEQYFAKRYADLNVKETLRKGLRNLYFARLIVLKPFWNSKINDFDVRSCDPRKVRVGKYATKEQESEFAIEEISDSILAVIKRFPKKKQKILEKYGYTDENDPMLLIENKEITYKEAWIRDRLMCSFPDMLLDDVPNPYWDWQGLMITDQEEQQLQGAYGEARRNLMQSIKGQQQQRKPQEDQQKETIETDYQEQPESLKQYFFNHFDFPRKPYIIATVFNNENSPLGRTDMITQAIPLQESLDRRKRQIDDNAEIMNGVIKVDSAVMDKAEAQKLRYETSGIIWGKGVANGVSRETGTALPDFIFKDLQDSRDEIDNIMAASSAFRGEREGDETKGGRLALIEQSYLSLNELVQVVDYVNYELFNWFYQLAKVRYTEYHYAKTMGPDEAVKTLEIIQDDFEDGTDVRVIPGKMLPEDKQFQYQRAQEDVQEGLISPVDYFEVAGYNDPKRMAKNSVMYKINPIAAVGLTPEEMQSIQPPSPPKQAPPAPEKPSESISFKDLPPEGKAQMAAQAGIQLDPGTIAAHDHQQQQSEQQNTIEQMKVKSQLVPKPIPK